MNNKFIFNLFFAVNIYLKNILAYVNNNYKNLNRNTHIWIFLINSYYMSKILNNRLKNK